MHDLTRVRLILTDMDGTLLNSRMALPDHLFETIEKLDALGIRFGIASGRSYPTLAELFAPVRDKMLFMAETGGCIVDRGRLLAISPLSEAQVAYLLDECRPIPGLYPICSCYEHAYILKRYPPEVIETVHRFYRSVSWAGDLYHLPEPVCKVTVCDLAGAEHYGYPRLAHISSPLRVTLSGQIWIDLCPEGNGKGAGLARIQESFGLTPAQTMAFGDYLNDCDMMPHAYYSYAMANAHPDLAAVCRFRTLSNDEDGVMRILRELLKAHGVPVPV